MAQFIGDYLKSNFRSFHDKEPLEAHDVNFIVHTVKNKFPNASEKYIKEHIEHVFDVAELKTYKFTSVQYVEAYSEQQAKEEFANNSMNFAANADCEEA